MTSTLLQTAGSLLPEETQEIPKPNDDEHRLRMSEPPIVKVLNCLHRSHPGGAHWRIILVGQRLEKYYGIETVIAFPEDDCDLYSGHLEKIGFPYVRIRMQILRRKVSSLVRFFASFPRDVRAFSRVLEEQSISIVTVNGVTNLQPVISALMSNRKVLWYFNDMATPKVFVTLVSPLFQHPNVQLAVATDAISEHYGLRARSPILYLPAPVPLPEGYDDEPVSREALGLPSDAVIVGFIGNLVPIKGVDDLIRAVIPIMRQRADVHAVVVGPTVPTQSDYARRLQAEVATTPFADRIHFVGFRRNIPSWQRLFDVFVLPSRADACPNVVLEAMQVGTPLVVTRVGDTPRMRGQLPFPMVEPGNIEGLCRGIEEMLGLSPGARGELSQRLQRRVQALYSLKKVTDEHARIYRELSS